MFCDFLCKWCYAYLIDFKYFVSYLLVCKLSRKDFEYCFMVRF